MLSSWDDYPVHQNAEPIRFVGTSDRNFYDRYYFNCHGSSDELMMIFGMGQYPNLGTQDAFAVIRIGDLHRVVRASRVLGDRMENRVGPFEIEVIKPLEELRVTLDDTEHGLSFDLTWKGSIPAHEEPRHYIRKHGRVLFDTTCFAQTGCWSGTITLAAGPEGSGVEAQTIGVTPDRWKGTRDRSWGVRPIGEKEHPGIRQESGSMTGMWNYFPMQFDDHSIIYMLNETAEGERLLEEGVRVWSDPDREDDWLGVPEWDLDVASGTRQVTEARITFPSAPEGSITVVGKPLTHCFVSIGTGYGIEDDWIHGMYQGDLVVQGHDQSMADITPLGQYTLWDHVAEFTYADQVGYGLLEHGFFGAFPKVGLDDAGSLAP